ncbi:MAG: hypothetical protein IPM29_23035 [Planctomycetes bacterium]|nr:hypothetical protein [Planctomycetota bacterium]
MSHPSILAVLSIACLGASLPPLAAQGGPPQARVTSIGIGCRGPTGLESVIIARGGTPRLGNASFALLASYDIGTSVPLVSFAAARLPTPLPFQSCDLWLDPSRLVTARPLDAQFRLPLPIPNDPALLGATFYAQGVAIDIVNRRAILSNALEIVVGT